MKYLNLEKRIKKIKKNKYSKIFIATETGAIAGNEVGIRLSDVDLPKTGWTLSGDFIGGTIGVYLAQWYTTKEKFRDENGKFKWREFFKDNTKVTVYGGLITIFAYSVSGNITYQLIKHNVDETFVGLANWFVSMVIWNSLYYHVYDAIKHNKDEKLAVKIYKKIKKN